MTNDKIRTIVMKLAAGEILTTSEQGYASHMPKAIPKLVRLEKNKQKRQMAIARASEVAIHPVVAPSALPPRGKYGPHTAFYQSEQWRRLRYAAIVSSQGRCLACGASAASGAELKVDHIIPISKAPHLKAEPGNLQVLCNECNHGKGAWDQTDWRGPAPVGTIQ